MEKIGIFYGSTTGITESVAYRLAELMHVKKEDILKLAKEYLESEYSFTLKK